MNSGRSKGELPSTPLFFKEGWGKIFLMNPSLALPLKRGGEMQVRRG
jgi:hypothetical protein